jgi:hypothetical protein
VELVLPHGQPGNARMEAITSRPLMPAAVGKAASHAGQTTLIPHAYDGKASILKSLIANIHAALQTVRVPAEQLKPADPWAVLVRNVSDKIAPHLARSERRVGPAVGQTGRTHKNPHSDPVKCADRAVDLILGRGFTGDFAII